MSEPTDNIPMEWPKRGRSLFRERISEAQLRRRMVDFAKFVTVHVMDALEPEELLDAWIEQTYNKPKVTKLSQV